MRPPNGCEQPSAPPGVIARQKRTPGHRTSAERKAAPVFGGCFAYFPDALLAVAELSKVGNDKHNPGQPLHWSREKSNDHADCAGRHLLDIGPEWTDVDPEDGLLHAQKLAWRSLATLQVAIERVRAREAKATPTSPPCPLSGFWVPWKGGVSPVPHNVRIEAELRDGTRAIYPAGEWEWGHEPSHPEADIVYYRHVA